MCPSSLTRRAARLARTRLEAPAAARVGRTVAICSSARSNGQIFGRLCQLVEQRFVERRARHRAPAKAPADQRRARGATSYDAANGPRPRDREPGGEHSPSSLADALFPAKSRAIAHFSKRGLLKVVLAEQIVRAHFCARAGHAGFTVTGESLAAFSGAAAKLKLGAGVAVDAEGVVRGPARRRRALQA